MVKRGEKLQKFIMLLIVWALLLATMIAYERYFVSSQKIFLEENEFHTLERVAEELNSQVRRAEVSTQSFVQLAQQLPTKKGDKDNPELGEFLRLYLPGLWSETSNSARHRFSKAANDCVVGEDSLPALQTTNKGLALTFSCVVKPGSPFSTENIYTLDLTPWIRASLEPLGGDFDDVLLADETGNVLFQKSSTAPRVTDLKPLVLKSTGGAGDTLSVPAAGSSAPGNAKPGATHNNKTGDSYTGNPSSNEKPNVADTKRLHKLTDASFFTDTTFAGQDYELFSVPVRIRLKSISGAEPLSFVVSGLRREEGFEADSRAIPYSTLIWATLITVAIFSLSWPLAKLRYMSQTERFTPREGWFLVLTICLAATSGTLMLLNASYTSQAQEEVEKNLKILADRIKLHFQDEMLRARDQMKRFEYRKEKTNLIPNYLVNGKQSLDRYPYFEIVSWSNSNGQQVLKFDIRPAPTPLVNVAQQLYFARSMSERNWPARLGNSDTSLTGDASGGHLLDRYYLDPLFSQTTAEFVPVLAAAYSAHHNPAVLAVAVRPMSLVEPVLPPGYGFALIDADCYVLFHSEAFRDKRENFCQQSKGTAELRPWLFGGTDNFIDISYAGRPERAFFSAFMKPDAPDSSEMPQFAGGQTYLVVFRSPDYQLTLNLAVMLVCAILIGFYFVLFAAALGLYRVVLTPLRIIEVPRLMWPCAENGIKYLHLFAANCVVLLSFWVFYRHLYEFPLLSLTLFVAFFSVCVVVVKLSFRDWLLLRIGLTMTVVASVVLLVSAVCTIAGLPNPIGEWASVFAVIGIGGALAILLWGVSARGTTLFALAPKISERLRHFAAANFAFAYTLATLTVIAGVCIVPCVGCFKFAYDSVTEVGLKHDQIAVSNALLARRGRIREYYDRLRPAETGSVSREQDGQKAETRIDETARWRIAEDSDRYDRYDNELGFCYTSEGSLGLGSDRSGNCKPPQAVKCTSPKHEVKLSFTERMNARVERGIARAVLMYPANQLGSEMSKLGVASTETFAATGEHCFDELKPNQFRLNWNQHSKLEGFTVWSRYPIWKGFPWWGDVLILVFGIVQGLWLASIVRRIFLTDVQRLRATDVAEWKQASDIRGNFLVVGLAKSGKSEWLRSISGILPENYCDLAAELKRIVEGGPYPSSFGEGSVIVLDSFEFNLTDPGYNTARLNLLEHLMAESSLRIVLVSSVDPLYYLAESGPEVLSDPADPATSASLLDRWVRVLSKFERIRPKIRRDQAFIHKINKFVKDHREHREFAIWVRQECKRTSMLRKFGNSLLDDFDPSNPATREWVENSVLDMAAEYYHVLWAGLTANEHLALYQLALDGWANPKNTSALQQLESKLLIRRIPMYRIMNESFRRFVASPEHAKEIEEWQKQQKQSSWRVLRLVLIGLTVIAAAWLLHSQAALSQELAAYIAGIATLLTAISALFSRSGKPVPPKVEPS